MTLVEIGRVDWTGPLSRLIGVTPKRRPSALWSSPRCCRTGPGPADTSKCIPAFLPGCGTSETAASLVPKAWRVGGEKTKKATVTRALEEFIARRRQKKILELFGKLEWNPDFDYKRERKR